MKLTTFTDDNLRVLLCLASEPGQRATIAEIATAFGINVNHLGKVANFLGQQGWVHTVRGKGGGLELAVPCDQLLIGEVVRRCEGADRPAECFDRATSQCRMAGVYRLRGVLDEAVRAFHEVLDRYTLADLAHHRAALMPLLRA